MSNPTIVDLLLKSEEPSIRWKVRVNVLGEPRESREIGRLEAAVRMSNRVAALLAPFDAEGRLPNDRGVYMKWQGAHWVLATLADIGYPRGDRNLLSLRNRVLDAWLDERWFQSFTAFSKKEAHRKRGVPVMCGRHRRCASQQGNALYALTRLGFDDPRLDQLAERLLFWQWPDGGWNCDKNPEADTSSFMETLLPMKGLFVHGTRTGNTRALEAAQKASKVFLKRKLFRRHSDGEIIRSDFLNLHYPLYWHYDILTGLRAMLDLGRLGDRRCKDALDLLEAKRLPDGGWPAEARYYKAKQEIALSNDSVDWGGVSKKKMNPWVTVDALQVLRAAGRRID